MVASMLHPLKNPVSGGPYESITVNKICPSLPLSHHLPSHSTPAVLASSLLSKYTKHALLKLLHFLFPLPECSSQDVCRWTPPHSGCCLNSTPSEQRPCPPSVLPVLLTWLYLFFSSHLSPPGIVYSLRAYFLSLSTGVEAPWVKDFILFLLYPQCLEQCQSCNRYLINTCWINDWLISPFFDIKLLFALFKATLPSKQIYTVTCLNSEIFQLQYFWVFTYIWIILIFWYGVIFF